MSRIWKICSNNVFKIFKINEQFYQVQWSITELLEHLSVKQRAEPASELAPAFNHYAPVCTKEHRKQTPYQYIEEKDKP
jgi:hypothetical protein